jgi:beta-glucanase (GH16 family)
MPPLSPPDDGESSRQRPETDTPFLPSTFLAVAAVMALALSGKSAGAQSAPEGTSWRLVWSDEFNGPDGSAPDPKKWTYDIGVDDDGWGNKELEYYTNRLQNAVVQGGNLVITALRENYTGPRIPVEGHNQSQSGGQNTAEQSSVTRDYTSARLKTQGLFAQAYGRFEARIKIPYGQGMWPAFWMLGDDIDKVDWPRCGEIDIMENIGKEPNKVHGSIHGPGPAGSGTDDMTAVYTLSAGQRFCDAFHIFAVEWEPKVIRFYVDDTLYETATPSGLPKESGWKFDHPFFLLLNLAVGGDWPGSPDDSTHFPQQMLVDYVRVYARESGAR